MKLKLYLLAFLGILLYSYSVDVEKDRLEVFSNIAYSALSAKQKPFLSRDNKHAGVEAWTNGNYLKIFLTKKASRGTIRVVVDPKNGGVI
jgi:hypothetical protein